jgi:hypothetical protein
MTHPFDRYFAKHSHYPRIRLNNGMQRILIEFAPGYVLIRTYPWGGEVYILRSTWIELLKRAILLTKKWDRHPDHDVPQAMRQSYLAETLLLEEKRAMKKDPDRQDRQRQRFLAARARQARRESP